MDIIIGQETIQYNRQSLNLDELYQTINETLNRKGYRYDHLIADGVALSNPDQYILDNYPGIQRLQVVYRTEEEFFAETWKMTITFLDEIIPQAKALGTDFYQNSKEDIWDRLIKFIDMLDLLFRSYDQISVMEALLRAVGENRSWQAYANAVAGLKKQMTCLQIPMEGRDTISIADVIQWEIMPALSEMRARLGELVRKG